MTFAAMCIFNFFYWIHDIISSIKMYKLANSEEDVVDTTVKFIKLFFLFIPIKLTWIYTSLDAMHYLNSYKELPGAQVVFTIFGFLELFYCLVLATFFILFTIGFFLMYLSSLKYGIKCNFNFFRKIYLVSDFTSDDTNIIYDDNNHCRSLHFSFFSHIVACFMLNSKYHKFSKDKNLDEQKEFYEMVIQDLQEKQKENEKKAQEYLSHAQKNEEDILDNFHKTLERQKKRK